MDFSRLDDFLDKNTGNEIVPGSSCIIHYKNEKVYLKNTGFSDFDTKEKMTENTLLNFYSMTKPVTCALALTLYEKGLYLLNDPLYKYMPEFKDMTVKKIIDGREEIIPCSTPITVRDLFTMCAGFDYNINSPAVIRAKEKTNGCVPTVDFVKELSKEPLLFEPGTRWEYSLCHDVLGAFIEVVSGKKLSELMSEVIFKPLGMGNTGFYIDEFGCERLGTQYDYNPKTKKADKVSHSNMFKLGEEYESGGAGLISCAQDYSKFAYAMANKGVGINGKRILSEATINLMRTNCLNEESIKSYDWPDLAGYGYGLGVRTMMDLANAGSNGSVGEFAWNGAAGSYALFDPQKQLSVTYTQHVLMNNGGCERIHSRLRNVIYSCLD